MVETEIPTIAVLPFVVVTAEQETDHFADGLTDEVITDVHDQDTDAQSHDNQRCA